MRVEKIGSAGFAVCTDATIPGVQVQVQELIGDNVPLIIADPPYGNILNAKWDNRYGNDEEPFVQWMLGWTLLWSRILLPNGAFYVWGGIGTPGFRPFFRYLSEIEHRDDIGLKIANLITWKKKRAYGVRHNYLFTREECVYLIKGDDIKKPRCFNIPLLQEKRGYAGYNKKYPAKSEYYRRTNVWTDVTEVMHGKAHVAQKAQRVIEIPIEVHTQPWEWVIDPFAGSGTTALAALRLGRRFIIIENDPEIFETMLQRVKHAAERVGLAHDKQSKQDLDRKRAI